MKCERKKALELLKLLEGVPDGGGAVSLSASQIKTIRKMAQAVMEKHMDEGSLEHIKTSSESLGGREGREQRRACVKSLARHAREHPKP